MTTILTDCIVILLPLALVVFVALVWSKRDSRVNEEDFTSWENAIKVAATVLPIIFASVVGRLMSEATHWRLEHGDTVGSLEQLMGSRTVGGTITTLFQFQSWNLITLVLLAVWALSPLGDPIATANVEAKTRLRTEQNEHYLLRQQREEPTGLYTTVVSMPEKSKLDTMDLWGNVKIPYLDSVNRPDWKDVPQNLSTDGYSSLVGVPLSHINHINPNTSDSFTLESSYIQLQCNEIVTKTSLDGSTEDILNGHMLDDAYSDFGGLGRIYSLPNGTWHGFPRDSEASWSLGINRFVDPLWFGGNRTNRTEFKETSKSSRASDLHRPNLFTNENGIEAGPTGLIIQATCKHQYTLQPELFFTGYCDITQRYVESRVNCTWLKGNQQICAVTAQRPSQQPHALDAITPLSFPVIFRGVSKELPRTTGGTISYQTEPSLYHLADPSLKAMGGGELRFLENVTKMDLGIRLGQLLNTYLQLTQMPQNMYGGAADGSTLDPNITVIAENTENVVLFGVSNGWAGLCLVSCVAMLMAGVLSVAIAHWARSPEILGYVSTVLRDSRHIELPEGSYQLTASELSERMAKERIRYGVIRNEKGEDLCIGVGREEVTGGITKKRAN
ncbi:hypothetical protein PG999_007432 [Apiospora kogelbergensis]|uniref:Uncharacterized protein n=1 Tax=Apiospora kogelbergensis TaxID=1337665 RepID=A0AAW0QYE5_9PEZI